MTTLDLLVKKLLAEPSALQFLVVADCLDELGRAPHAAAARLGFDPNICQTWLGYGTYNAATGCPWRGHIFVHGIDCGTGDIIVDNVAWISREDVAKGCGGDDYSDYSSCQTIRESK